MNSSPLPSSFATDVREGRKGGHTPAGGSRGAGGGDQQDVGALDDGGPAAGPGWVGPHLQRRGRPPSLTRGGDGSVTTEKYTMRDCALLGEHPKHAPRCILGHRYSVKTLRASPHCTTQRPERRRHGGRSGSMGGTPALGPARQWLNRGAPDSEHARSRTVRGTGGSVGRPVGPTFDKATRHGYLTANNTEKWDLYFIYSNGAIHSKRKIRMRLRKFQ